MTDFNQDEIDKLLQEALADAGDDASDPAPMNASQTSGSASDYEGPASQDDIDALFAAVDAGDFDAAPAAANEPVPEAAEPAVPAPEAAAPSENAFDMSGMASQDDIDALFSAAAETEPEIAGDEHSGAKTADEQEPELPAKRDDTKALFESQLAEAEAAADQEAANPNSEINALLSSIAGEDEETPEETSPDTRGTELHSAPEEASEPSSDSPAPETPADEAVSAETGAAETPAAAPGGDAIAGSDEFDMDALLREVAEAVPPPPPPKPSVPDAADTAILTPDVSAALAQAEAQKASQAPPPRIEEPVVPPPAAVPPPSEPSSPPRPEARREFSVLYGAGEVESIANQITALLASLSEKAHGYMQAWIAADSEAKELRSRALAEERRRTSLESEKRALAAQLDELRTHMAELEGNKVALEEARRTLETSYQARIRELESRASLLGTEAETLKDELTRSRNQATGVDIESRRVRFEAERLKSELESERMERLRIQRALENREKELQAMQAQSAGQASSLFIDELHRLVRRLESELEARSSGAHDALRILDRLETSPDMVPVVANLRAALMQAVGRDADADDALKSLGREASGIKGPAAIAPAKPEMISFETALSTYNLEGAVDVAGALLRDGGATAASLMRKVYQCPALRRPEAADYIGDLARLLEGLRTVQEATDRSRGSETSESEVFYVHMFDFLHNLVRLKLINRLSGDIWRLFLDLRGRFSFVTSDKQWAEYRDKTLNDNKRKD